MTNKKLAKPTINIIDQQQHLHQSNTDTNSTIMSNLTRRNYQNNHQINHRLHLHRRHKSGFVGTSEYKNLRQVVPSLKRQRDVGKVEVVTEAARYIDHLHKTLIERFVLCGIPDSLKGKFFLNFHTFW